MGSVIEGGAVGDGLETAAKSERVLGLGQVALGNVPESWPVRLLLESRKRRKLGPGRGLRYLLEESGTFRTLIGSSLGSFVAILGCIDEQRGNDFLVGS